MNKKRPVNLDLSTIKLPLPAITSILHRISGFALFFAIALLLYALGASLESQASFTELQVTLDNPLCKIIMLAILAALVYHLVAGIKHLLMDWGIGETIEGGRIGAIATLVIAAILFLLLGGWVW